MKRLTLILCFCASLATAADIHLGTLSGLTWTGSGTTRVATWATGGGDPGTPASGLSLAVDARGWDAYLTIPGVTTNGTFSFGYTSTTNYLTNATLTLTVSSYGYDDVGAATTIQRTIHATHALRLPYPALTGSVVIVTGTDIVPSDTTNAIVRLALDEYIYTNETITGLALGGLYSVNGTNTPAGTIQVSNGSTQTVARTIANWSYPGFQRITNTTFQLRSLAFHRSAEQGRPVRVVKFWAHDNQGHTNTQYVTNMSVSAMDCDRPGVAISEYIADMNASTFAQAATVTCHFAAYPWVGDAASVCDTSDGLYTNNNTLYTPFWAPQTWICDTGNLWGVSVAVVNTNGGSDTAGVVVKAVNFDSESPPAAFATIAGAANKMQSSNSAWYGRADCGAGLIYLQSGSHSWPGSTAAVGGTPQVWTEVLPFPGLTKSDVTLTNYGNGVSYGLFNNKFKLSNLTLGNTSAYLVYNTKHVWLNNCQINNTSSSAFGGTGLYQITGCQYGSVGQGLVPFSGIAYWGLIRGCVFETFSSLNVSIYTTIGNLHTNYLGKAWTFTAHPSTLTENGKGAIFAYNKIMAMSNTTQRVVNTSGNPNMGTNTIGIAVVQNLVENINAYSAVGGWFAADGESNAFNNVLLWHNTTVGCRWNMNYNDTGTNAYLREQWSVANNWVDMVAQKSDMFANGEVGVRYSGGRVGNWPTYNGVGMSGNYFGDTLNVVTFLPDWMGRNGFIAAYSAAISATNFFPFVDRRSAKSNSDPLVGGSGNGDYHITNAPIQSVRWVIPYDLDGNPRTGLATNNQIGCFK